MNLNELWDKSAITQQKVQRTFTVRETYVKRTLENVR